ncbi:hypothetical protein POM88_011511 [Heracleum sosnowskyi]|uniref:RNase H type-1 domain-containing protein n=1 Tax=Heracleum sosnowskyi TaxID=360622 RepID=A0AAD8IYG8_9APIA|nr:hypothetical protein POM88_011511 [Heracleum sosnowskyi]
MLGECDLNVGMTVLFYKLPSSVMDLGLFPVNCDKHVVEMCNILDGSRLMYVYCETIEETQVEEITLSQYAYPNTTQELEFEKQQLLDIFNVEGIPEDMYDIDHLLSKHICDEQTSEVSDHDNVSFHEDSSNIDNTYEDVRSHKAKMVDVPIETLNWNTKKSQIQQVGPSNDGNVPNDAHVTSEAHVPNDAPVTSEAPVPSDAHVPVRGLGGCIGLADPVTAELWAIYYGLKMVWERNKTNLVVFFECREAISIIHNDDPEYPMTMLVDMIRMLLGENWISVDIQPTQADAN